MFFLDNPYKFTYIISRIHDSKKPATLQPMQDQLENIFKNMKRSVEEKYGERPREFTVQKITTRAPSEGRLSGDTRGKH